MAFFYHIIDQNIKVFFSLLNASPFEYPFFQLSGICGLGFKLKSLKKIPDLASKT
jgi:hypothetical protein